MSGRCASCNEAMNDFEMTRKNARTGEYMDLCSGCLSPIIDEFELVEREDLRSGNKTEALEIYGL